MNLERNLYRQNAPEAYLYSHTSERELTGAEEGLADFLNKETDSFRQPSFGEFNEVYSLEQLAKDARTLKQATGRFENYSGERSDMVTRLLLHLVYDLEYLKPKNGKWEIYAGLTHPYDDKLRGSDMVIVFYNHKTGEELPIAVDTTTSLEYIDEKLDKIRRDFQHGNLRKLKYYKSPVSGEAIGEKEMPAVILGYSPDNFQKVARAWQKAGDQGLRILEKSLRTELADQLEAQIENVGKFAPAHLVDDLTSKLEKTASLFLDSQNKQDKKEGTTEVVPIRIFPYAA